MAHSGRSNRILVGVIACLASMATQAIAQQALIQVVKVTNGTDNNSPPGPSVPIGSTVTFTYTVTNSGNGPLSNVTVRDDNGTPGNPADDFNATFTGGDTNANGLLDPTETWTFLATRIATAGQYTNVATATGTAAPATQVTSTDPDNHFGALPTATPTPTATATSTPTTTATSTPTTTATSTPTATPSPSPTGTASPSPTAIGGGAPPPEVPMLSFPMLALLGAALFAAGYFVIRRNL